jgi:hypothetical protein
MPYRLTQSICWRTIPLDPSRGVQDAGDPSLGLQTAVREGRPLGPALFAFSKTFTAGPPRRNPGIDRRWGFAHDETAGAHCGAFHLYADPGGCRVSGIDRLTAIFRLDMPPARSRSTSRILRIGNLCLGMSRSLLEGVEALLIRRSPNGVRHTRPQPGRDRPEWVVAINRNDWWQSIGISGRNPPVRAFRASGGQCCPI